MLLTWRKHLGDRKGRFSHKTSLASQFCIELHVPSQDNGRLRTRVVDFGSFPTIFQSSFGTVYYFCFPLYYIWNTSIVLDRNFFYKQFVLLKVCQARHYPIRLCFEKESAFDIYEHPMA